MILNINRLLDSRIKKSGYGFGLDNGHKDMVSVSEIIKFKRSKTLTIDCKSQIKKKLSCSNICIECTSI